MTLWLLWPTSVVSGALKSCVRAVRLSALKSPAAVHCRSAPGQKTSNPSLKALATEEYGKRETSLFGPGFLEKASRRLEAEKTLSKVSSQGNKGGPPSKKARYENDKSDLNF